MSDVTAEIVPRAGARLAIADPPYPPHRATRRDRVGGRERLVVRSRARRWYGDGTRAMNDRAADVHADAGDWDQAAMHWALVEQLMDSYDGWAIATSMDGLDYYRPLPVPTTTLIWHKPNGHDGEGRVRATLEAVIVRIPEGRRGRRGVGQVEPILTAGVSPGFAGRKPERWTRWVLDVLGHDPETDTVDDLFPGSGAVSAVLAQPVLSPHCSPDPQATP